MLTSKRPVERLATKAGTPVDVARAAETLRQPLHPFGQQFGDRHLVAHFGEDPLPKGMVVGKTPDGLPQDLGAGGG